MKIFEVNKNDRTSELISDLLKIWEDSVRATHLFLSNEELENIKRYVPMALKDVSHLIIAKDENNIAVAFMGIESNRLEMLFIRNNERGKGLGKELLTYAIKNYKVNELTVNEQNPNAIGFYEHLGFKIYKRSKIDEQGNPYPILYMKI